MSNTRLLENKKALILGVANDRSIAWGIAQSFKNHGAKIALSYLNDSLKKRVEPLGESIGAEFLCQMDVSIPEHYHQLHEEVKKQWGTFDILVHCLAFADSQDLKNRFIDTSREGYLKAIDISAYSLVGLCKSLEDLFNPDSKVLALTYHGSVQVIRNYNVMGVAKAALECSMRYLSVDLGANGHRINCISAGPIKTLSAGGVSGFRDMLNQVEELTPLKRKVTPSEVGDAATYLCSSLSHGVTGQVHYVDSGQAIMGNC